MCTFRVCSCSLIMCAGMLGPVDAFIQDITFSPEMPQRCHSPGTVLPTRRPPALLSVAVTSLSGRFNIAPQRCRVRLQGVSYQHVVDLSQPGIAAVAFKQRLHTRTGGVLRSYATTDARLEPAVIRPCGHRSLAPTAKLHRYRACVNRWCHSVDSIGQLRQCCACCL